MSIATGSGHFRPPPHGLREIEGCTHAEIAHAGHIGGEFGDTPVTHVVAIEEGAAAMTDESMVDRMFERRVRAAAIEATALRAPPAAWEQIAARIQRGDAVAPAAEGTRATKPALTTRATLWWSRWKRRSRVCAS